MDVSLFQSWIKPRQTECGIPVQVLERWRPSASFVAVDRSLALKDLGASDLLTLWPRSFYSLLGSLHRSSESRSRVFRWWKWSNVQKGSHLICFLPLMELYTALFGLSDTPDCLFMGTFLCRVSQQLMKDEKEERSRVRLFWDLTEPWVGVCFTKGLDCYSRHTGYTQDYIFKGYKKRNSWWWWFNPKINVWRVLDAGCVE